MFTALAAQKHYCSLYLMAIYASPDLMAHLEKAGIGFRKVEDIPLQEILNMLAEISLEEFLSPGKSLSKFAKRGTLDKSRHNPSNR